MGGGSMSHIGKDRHETTIWLFVLFALATTVACATHRSHPIVNVQQGWCEHNQCARKRVRQVKPYIDRSYSESIEYKGIKVSAEQALKAADVVDREINNLLAGPNSVMTSQ